MLTFGSQSQFHYRNYHSMRVLYRSRLYLEQLYLSAQQEEIPQLKENTSNRSSTHYQPGLKFQSRLGSLDSTLYLRMLFQEFLLHI